MMRKFAAIALSLPILLAEFSYGMSHVEIRRIKIAEQARRYAAPDYLGPAPIIVVGTSHKERGPWLELADLIGRPVINAGIAGATFHTLRHQIPWSELRAARPFRVVVEGGINDANNRVPIDEHWLDDVKWVFTYAQMGKARPVIVTSPSPENLGPGAAVDQAVLDRINALIVSLATENTLWAGIQEPLDSPFPIIDARRRLNADLKDDHLPSSGTVDSIHLSHEAYRSLIRLLAPVLEPDGRQTPRQLTAPASAGRP